MGTIKFNRAERPPSTASTDDGGDVGHDVDILDEAKTLAPPGSVSRYSEFESGKPVDGLLVRVDDRQIAKCATILSSNDMVVSRERSAKYDVWSEGTVRRLALEKSRFVIC